MACSSMIYSFGTVLFSERVPVSKKTVFFPEQFAGTTILVNLLCYVLIGNNACRWLNVACSSYIYVFLFVLFLLKTCGSAWWQSTIKSYTILNKNVSKFNSFKDKNSRIPKCGTVYYNVGLLFILHIMCNLITRIRIFCSLIFRIKISIKNWPCCLYIVHFSF